MTETIASVSSKPKEPRKERSWRASAAELAELAAVAELVRAARAHGHDITGLDGLLTSITATVLEAASEEEMTDHLGHAKHQSAADGGTTCNGTRAKTVSTDAAGEVQIEVPARSGRDVRAGDREEAAAAPLSCRRGRDLVVRQGLTTGEISAHFAEVYGASISKDTVSRITDRVVEEMQGWCSRPLQGVYAAIFIDAVYVKVRDGQVGNQPTWAGAATCSSCGPGRAAGESAKFWMNVLADLKNRGVAEVFFIVCNGLKGVPDSVAAAVPQGIARSRARTASAGTVRGRRRGCRAAAGLRGR